MHHILILINKIQNKLILKILQINYLMKNIHLLIMNKKLLDILQILYLLEVIVHIQNNNKLLNH